MRIARLSVGTVSLIPVSLLSAQEGSSVEFNPIDMGPSLTDWRTLLGAFVMTGMLCLFLWLLSWRAARRPVDRQLRYWFPTLMVVACCAIAWAEETSVFSPDSVTRYVVDSVFVALGLLNFPVIAAVGLLVALFVFVAPWVLNPVAMALSWCMWYWVVRFFEHRAAANSRPILSLDLQKFHQ